MTAPQLAGPALEGILRGHGAGAAAKGVVIEQGCRLSDSALWPLMRRYFEGTGIAAWGKHGLPSYVTSNPQLAHAFAKIIQGFLRDCLDNGMRRDSVSPFTIVELAAGSGRFGFHLLKELRLLAKAPPFDRLPVRLILTDLSQANIDAWRGNPAFAPFVEDGALDFARFDMEHDTELTTLISGWTVDEWSNPTVFIANYAFDSLKQDALIVAGGKVREGLVKLTAPHSMNLAELSNLPDLSLAFEAGEAADSFYPDPQLDAIVRGYGRLPDTTLLMPIGALGCLDRLQRLTGGRMLVLAADKGMVTDEDLVGARPNIVPHAGCFSMEVNSDAIGRFVAGRGGFSLLPEGAAKTVHVAAHLFGFSDIPNRRPQSRSLETCAAYDEHVRRRSPDDRFLIAQALWRLAGHMTPEEIAAFVRSTGHDPVSFVNCAKSLTRGLLAAKSEGSDEVRRLVDAVQANYLPIGEQDDLEFWLGRCLWASTAHKVAQAARE